MVYEPRIHGKLDSLMYGTYIVAFPMKEIGIEASGLYFRVNAGF